MSQCVPHWDTDEHTNEVSPSLLIHAGSSHHPEASHVLFPENEMAELTWENGQLSLQGLAHDRTGKPAPKYPATAAAAWGKPGPTGTGTLESLVDQATRAQLLPFPTAPAPWPHRQVPPTAPAVDAVVPCSSLPHADPHTGASVFKGSSGGGQRAGAGEASQGSAEPTRDTCEEVEDNTTSASPSLREEEEGGDGSPDTENTSFACGQPPTIDEHDYVGHSRRSNSKRERDDDEKASKGKAGRSTISTKRSRAAAVHNQSERKRRDRINQKMRTLQKLVPNSSKTDKASMLDEVIEYLKQLQAQVQMMNRMGSIPPMMMPMNMQQLQISMMAQMAHLTQMAQMAQMGMGMMDLSAVGRPAGNTGMPSHVLPPPGVLPVFSPAAFFPLNAAPCDLSAAERMQPSSTAAMFADPFSAMHHAFPAQPMGMDAYNRMAALYQQMYQQNAGAKYS